MMKFLIIEQDLRVSGTSQGIISRSFLARLRIAYPQAIIDVVYLKHQASDDQLDLLPVDSIKSYILDLRIPFFTKWFNKIYWRLFHISLRERHIHKVYGSYIAKIEYEKYDHIFIRSAGLEHETILGAKDLPILKKAIVNFHDPYPVFWYAGAKKALSNLEMFRMKEMQKIVLQAKTCMSSAYKMSKDMQYLYGSTKIFYVLPHQYSESVFDLSEKEHVLKKTKKVTISYHGAIQFGRNADILLDAYQELVNENVDYKELTEFIMRIKGSDCIRLQNKYASTTNIQIFGTSNFSNSSNEQIDETDIAIILENGPIYCNILVGKAPFLAAYKKPILSISPKRSELRNCIIDQKYIATMDNKEEIKFKLEQLIIDRMNSTDEVYPFGDYFSDKNFKKSLDEILQAE